MKNQFQAEQYGGPYFAAANSGRGFVSYYGEIFHRDEIVKRYIIKGGPGTGKSSFLKKAADYGVACQKKVELYCCSSDPDSLDGVIIDGRIALLDGTAPHSEDTLLPGARDEIVNLGAFWDSERLSAQAERIQALDRKKGEAYGKAYRFLSACFALDAVDRTLLEGCLKTQKLRRAAERLCREIASGQGFSVETRMVDSVGMKGTVHFDSLVRASKQLYWIDDAYGAAPFLLSALADQAMEKHCAIQVARDVVSPDVLRSLLFVESGICFAAGNGKKEPMPQGAVRINMKRFFDGEGLSAIKGELRVNRRLREGLMDAAVSALREARDFHFSLETIYGACMDFEAAERFEASFCENVLKRLW